MENSIYELYSRKESSFFYGEIIIFNWFVYDSRNMKTFIEWPNIINYLCAELQKKNGMQKKIAAVLRSMN